MSNKNLIDKLISLSLEGDITECLKFPLFIQGINESDDDYRERIKKHMKE